MFLASLRTVVMMLTSNAAANRVSIMMVSSGVGGTTFIIGSRLFARSSHGPHRHDHRDASGNHQDGPGREGPRPAGPRPRPRAFRATLRPDDGPDLLPGHAAPRAGRTVRAEGAAAPPAGRDDDAAGRGRDEGGGPRNGLRSHEHTRRWGTAQPEAHPHSYSRRVCQRIVSSLE